MSLRYSDRIYGYSICQQSSYHAMYKVHCIHGPDPHSLGSLDPDPDSESGPRGIKSRAKAEFNQQIFFSSLNIKKVANLVGLCTDLKIFSSSVFLKDGLKLIDIDPDPYYSNFVDPDTTNPDPHYCSPVSPCLTST